MPEKQDFKPEARCKYSDYCTLYNHGLLTLEAEIAMCGRGEPGNENYEPRVPEPAESMQSAHGGPCDAFEFYKHSDLIEFVRKHIGEIKEQYEKFNLWE